MTDPYPEFLSPLETTPREELEELQEARLLATITDAWQRSPIFQSTWKAAGISPGDIKSVADFQNLAPCFDKDSIRAYRDANNDPCGGLIDLADPRMKIMCSTSGTTGDPTPMPMRFRSSGQEAYARDYWHMGARPGDYLIAPVFTFRGGSANGQTCQNEAGFTPIYFSHTPDELPRIIEGLKRFRPSVCALISSPLMLALEKLLEKSSENPKELFSCLKGSIFGGEALSPRIKKLADEWGIELYETTALGDVVNATQCKAHDGFHAYEDLAFVECLDPATDAPVADGEVGELVVTSINEPLLPMVRFRTDDLVSINREPCNCGRTHLRYHIHGRKSDQILVQGRNILPKDIRPLVENHKETAAGLFQIVKSAPDMDVLTVRVGYDPSKTTGPAKNIAAALKEELSAHLGVPVEIQLTLDDELLKLGPPHKIPRVTKQ